MKTLSEKTSSESEDSSALERAIKEIIIQSYVAIDCEAALGAGEDKIYLSFDDAMNIGTLLTRMRDSALAARLLIKQIKSVNRKDEELLQKAVLDAMPTKVVN